MPFKSTAGKRVNRATQRDLDTRIEFMEGLVRRDPNYVDALQLLGDHYTQRGRYTEGLQVDERLAHLDRKTRSCFTISRAVTRSPTSLTVPCLRWKKPSAWAYRDFAWLAKDPDLKKFRQQPAYDEIKAKIRRMKIKPR